MILSQTQKKLGVSCPPRPGIGSGDGALRKKERKKGVSECAENAASSNKPLGMLDSANDR